MSELSRFLKTNQIRRENTTYPATKSLTDEKGNPLLWTIKPISTKEMNKINESCTVQKQVPGKPNQFRNELDSTKAMVKMIVASVVEPNLNNKELQDSYGVMNPEDLVTEMINNPGEFYNFGAFINKFNGFEEGLTEKVEKAKN